MILMAVGKAANMNEYCDLMMSSVGINNRYTYFVLRKRPLELYLAMSM